MFVQNATVKVLTAPISGVSRVGNAYTRQNMILSWLEQQQDINGQTVNVEQTIHVSLGTNWVEHIKNQGIVQGSAVNVSMNLRADARGNFFDNNVTITGIERAQ